MFPLLLGAFALASAAALFLQDADPRLFSARLHEGIAAFSLAMIAVAYLVYQIVRRTVGLELAKSILLAAAFLSWSANQVCRNPREAALFNDIAIALFILDVFLVMAGLPSAAPDSSFAETWVVEEDE
jgi:hypothetical protein